MFLLFLGSIVATVTSLIISKSNKKIKYLDFIKDPRIFILNFLPIFFLSVILSGLEHILNGVAIVMFLVNTGALIHFYKVQFREEPLYFKDIFIIKEAADMTAKYPLSFKNVNSIVYFLSIAFIAFIQVYKRDFGINIQIVVTFIVGFICLLFVLTNKNLYKKIIVKGLSSHIALESYQSKGFIYPFLYSIVDIFEYQYKNYNPIEATKILSYYKEEHISGINFVFVMLESFKDFSKVKGNFEFEKDPYDYFHKLQEDSFSGGLIVDAFGGGTFTTEMEVLSGFKHLPKFKNKTETYVQYFKENGYKITAHHPYKAHFYGRDEVYPKIGLDNFKNYDNCFKKISEKPLKDKEFFEYLMNDFKENIKENDVFSFSVTYQNHGPYTKEVEGENFIKFKSSYDKGLFNYFNNYLRGISSTSSALEILTKNLNEIDQPTVLVIFGDHSPTMGEDKTLLDMLDINQDLSTIDGVKNLYETPYLFWANNALKKNIALKGKGKLLEPAFLVAELFDRLNLKGSQYEQFINDYSHNRSVIKDFLILDGKGEKTLLTKEQKHLYDNTQYHVQIHDKK